MSTTKWVIPAFALLGAAFAYQAVQIASLKRVIHAMQGESQERTVAPGAAGGAQELKARVEQLEQTLAKLRNFPGNGGPKGAVQTGLAQPAGDPADGLHVQDVHAAETTRAR